ncbi:sensor domain-containing protein [Mycolicibacterium stellerae]|uniref:sensor domain-containing protein n=1 Tax=Mycolicibacterium stellerae TaxID=2358193 RepID=UPI0013DE045F|nr:sensor domain-containing protein [Mycolicibacterium stellerae]
MAVTGGIRTAWGALCWAGAVAAAVLLTGCTVTADGEAVPAADLGRGPAPVAVRALDAFLLPPEQLSTLVGASELTVKDTFSQMYRGKTAAGDCAAAGQVPSGPVYAGSGWTAIRAQYLVQMRPDDSYQNKTWQAVVSFPLPVDAEAFFAKQVASWPVCNGRRVNVRNLDDPDATDSFWTLGDTTNTDGTLSIAQYEDGDSDWTCGVALTIRNNVAVNVQVCRNGIKDEAVDVAAAIVKKIPAE